MKLFENLVATCDAQESLEPKCDGKLDRQILQEITYYVRVM